MFYTEFQNTKTQPARLVNFYKGKKNIYKIFRHLNKTSLNDREKNVIKV